MFLTFYLKKILRQMSNNILSYKVERLFVSILYSKKKRTAMNKSKLNIWKIFFDLILSLFINKFIRMWRIFVFEKKTPTKTINEGKCNNRCSSCSCETVSIYYKYWIFFFLINIEDFNITIRKMRWLKYEGCVIFCCLRHNEPPSNNNIGIKTNKFINWHSILK